MGHYIPTTDREKKDMLAAIGMMDMQALFSSVPSHILADRWDLPAGLSELEVRAKMEKMADKNKVFSSIFRGAGAYNHYIPAIVKAITGKEEFLTAYTPYQAEISQGLLQSIFEYQTDICQLTGMDASNASVYDGATAAAEAVAMCKERKKNTVIVSKTIKPDTLEVIKTYCRGNGMEVVLTGEKEGRTHLQGFAPDDSIACVYVEQPNFFGLIEDVSALAEVTHQAGAKLIVGCNPISLGILPTPASCGADIAVGEGQSLGIPMGFGGPYLGFMACKYDLVRKLPGRIVGETVDQKGQRAFVLTLQAREQHIKREKASSNICSNEALCAMTAAVYLAALGATGLREVAVQCTSKAHYLATELSKIGYTPLYPGAFFHEFVTICPKGAQNALDALEQADILGGLPLDENTILWCTTEKNSKEDMDKLVAVLKEVG
ncbi:MAG TPA: aminomethyl-transferring glycine dehydrogenase subunit GcvPA [Clostridiales bacterium]|jgi:glycine dehydrogenase subunit 1|nr:aminomethyl-transferring glycine dehydrogenase subunit GcvPA [Clostridiales bacterium]